MHIQIQNLIQLIIALALQKGRSCPQSGQYGQNQPVMNALFHGGTYYIYISYSSRASQPQKRVALGDQVRIKELDHMLL